MKTPLMDLVEMLIMMIEYLVEVAVGNREGLACKPAPDTVLEAIRELNADPTTTVYVGDSNVDIETAQNAGIPCISVSWGFRSAEELQAVGATTIVNTAEELKQMLLCT